MPRSVALLMLSDGPDASPPNHPGTVSVALDFDDAAELRRSFDGLAEKGSVIVPVFNAPWGGPFGVVHDEFGVSWMLNGRENA
jgi:PhnB protein